MGIRELRDVENQQTTRPPRNLSIRRFVRHVEKKSLLNCGARASEDSRAECLIDAAGIAVVARNNFRD